MLHNFVLRRRPLAVVLLVVPPLFLPDFPPASARR